MKKNLLIISILFVLVSCSRKETTKLETFNAEAFAFQLESGWEVNASVRVKGFQQDTANENYTSKLSYNIGIITPQNDTVRNIAADQISESQKEEVSDLPVEVQIELDSTYVPGKYKLLFEIRDELSNRKTSAVKELDLE